MTTPVNIGLGTDVSCVEDVDAEMSSVVGRDALAQALARRLGTPKGGLWYDLLYGYDLRQLIGTSKSDAEIKAGIKGQCLQDERVLDIAVGLRRDGRQLFVQLAITDSFGTFVRTLAVSSVTVELLAT